MFRVFSGCFIAALFIAFSFGTKAAENSLVKLQTNYGDIFLTLNKEKAPSTVENFLRYVEAGRYTGTVFHRVKEDFVIQGGGYDKTYQPIEVFDAINNEAKNGLKNTRGTIAMARFTDKDSADSQFFINLRHNKNLDHRNDTNVGYGYTVFGQVVQGMDVVEAISKIPTGSIDDIGDSVPAYPVILQDVSLVTSDEVIEQQ